MDSIGRRFVVGIMIVASAKPLLSQSGANPPKVMTADSSPVFAVATIKPSIIGETLSIRLSGRRFMTTGASVTDLMAFAYGLHRQQITGGPSWIESSKYDVVAEPDGEGRPNNQQLRSMVQRLLADRWKMKVHRDTKELPVYAISVGKNLPKLTKTAGDPNAAAGVGFKPTGEITVRDATISEFGGFLQRYVLDRPVVDKTEIPGKYDISLHWTPDESQFGGAAKLPSQTADDPELPAAMEQQLGLRLRADRSLVEVLVIDQMERPSEN